MKLIAFQAFTSALNRVSLPRPHSARYERRKFVIASKEALASYVGLVAAALDMGHHKKAKEDCAVETNYGLMKEGVLFSIKLHV